MDIGFDPACVADLRRAYFRDHALLTVLALGAALGGIFFAVLVPDVLADTFVGQLVPGRIEIAWSLAWAMGGWLTLYGLWNFAPKIEAAGLFLLAGAWGTDALAVVDLRGAVGALSAFIFTCNALGSIARGVIRMRTRAIITR